MSQTSARFDALPLRDWRWYRRAEPLWFDTTIGLLILSGFCLLAGSPDQRLLDGVAVCV